jgi:peptidoglycan/LPS O-acetylase OafA/YrhL
VSSKNISTTLLPKLGYVPALDGLRAIAVTMVMFLHAHFFLGHNGAIGVDIFFTLSGFLITTLLLEEFHKKGTIDILSFYFRRTLRLFPALYLMLIVVLIYALTTTNSEDKTSLFKEISASALYINNVVYGIGWWKGYDPIALGHTWSLAVEEQFYLVWPCILFLLVKYFSVKWLKFVLLILFLFLFVNAQFHFYPIDIIVSEGLVLGCLVAVLRFSGNLPIKIPPFILIISLLLLTVYGIFPIPKLEIISTYFSNPNVIIEVLSLIAILGIVDASPDTLPIKIFGSNFFVYIGKLSYALYLWHKPVFVGFQKLSLVYHWTPSLTFVLKFIATFLFAILSWELMEKNIVQWGRNFLKKRQAAKV